jgi:hypothetical protein
MALRADDLIEQINWLAVRLRRSMKGKLIKVAVAGKAGRVGGLDMEFSDLKTCRGDVDKERHAIGLTFPLELIVKTSFRYYY